MDQVPRSLDIPQMRMTRRRDTSPIFVHRRAVSDQDHGSLVGKTLTQIVEMCYWVVKFVGDFEKVTFPTQKGAENRFLFLDAQKSGKGRQGKLIDGHDWTETHFFCLCNLPPLDRTVFLCFVSGTRNYNFPHDVLYFSAPDLSPPFLSESNRLCGKPKTIRNIFNLGLRTGPGGARQDLWRQLSLHHQADTVHRQVRQELREALLNILNILNISNHDEAINFVG